MTTTSSCEAPSGRTLSTVTHSALATSEPTSTSRKMSSWRQWRVRPHRAPPSQWSDRQIDRALRSAAVATRSWGGSSLRGAAVADPCLLQDFTRVTDENPAPCAEREKSEPSLVSARNRSSHCLVSGRSYHATIASLLSQCMGEKRRSSRFPRAPESHHRAHPGDQAQPGSADPKHGTGAGCWSPSMRLRKAFG